MKNPFDAKIVEEKIAEFERETGYELIVAATKSSDPYPGAAWRGATLLALIFSSLILHFWELTPRTLEVVLIGALILLLVYILRKANLHYIFALPSEFERETLQEAQATFTQFHSKELGHEASVLFYISLKEHKIHLVTSSDLKLDPRNLEEAILKMSHEFKQKCYPEGLVQAIEILKNKILVNLGKNSKTIITSVEDRVFWRE
jgi:uncharacterized membrane protein